MPNPSPSHHFHSSFPGFDLPQQNWFKMPNEWTDITADISSIAELKVVEYVLKHTWGYREYGIKKRITIDEFRFGRKRQDGSRLDRGTGLSKQSVITGIKTAVRRGLLEEEVDDRDKARVKKYYFLRMKKGQGGGNEGGVKKLDADVKDLDTGVQTLDSEGQRFQHRTEQDTLGRNQQQDKRRKNDDSSSDNGELDAALIEKGIEKKAAYHLTNTYARDRIEDNLDWLTWKQKNDPRSIKTNPAGLLRRAIEQDYAAGGHKGFQTRQQKAVASLAKKQRLQAQERLIYTRKQQQEASLQQKEKERVKRLEMLREQHHTGEREDRVWSQVMKILKAQVPGVSFKAYLASSSLLAIGEGKALIAVPNRFTKAQIEDRLSEQIQQALGQHLKDQVAAIECLTLDE
jgi:hypothetical protein